MLPLALGVLALGGLGKKALWAMEDSRMQGQIEAFQKAAQGMQEGLDLNSMEGVRQLALRQITDPRMIQYGNPLLSGILNMNQQNEQWKWGNENITAQQRAQNAMERERTDAQVAANRAQAAQGWENVAINRAQEKRLQDNMLWQQQNMDPFQKAQIDIQQQRLDKEVSTQWTGEKLQNYATGVYENAEKNIIQPYNKKAGAFSKLTSALDKADNPASAIASVYGFAGMLDEGGRVTEGDASTLSSLGGLGSKLAALIGEAEGKGTMPTELRNSIREVAMDLMLQQEQLARADLSRYRDSTTAADPYTQRPAINPGYFERAQMDVAERYAKQYRRAGQTPVPGAGGRIFIPGIGELKPVGD